MSPAAVEKVAAGLAPVLPNAVNGTKQHASTARRPPLVYSGSLDEYESFQVTNVIGKEFPKLQLSQIVNDDNKIRDLAILGEMDPPRSSLREQTLTR